eukprot:SAG31_NODE_4434_length_3233_cov_1.725909_3_plen_92_part_00
MAGLRAKTHRKRAVPAAIKLVSILWGTHVGTVPVRTSRQWISSCKLSLQRGGIIPGVRLPSARYAFPRLDYVTTGLTYSDIQINQKLFLRA